MTDMGLPAGRVRVLIVEDHKQLAENLFEYLGEERYELDYAADGLTALHLLANHSYDVVILDIMLPGVDGLSICQKIRRDLQSTVPVIMLTAKDSIDDKSQAFNSGADDYLVKPFHMHELELRLQALCRRQRSGVEFLVAGDLRYYPGTLKVTLEDHGELVLSGYGATIFATLMREYPRYVSHRALSESLWGNTEGDPHTIRTHVYSLRKLFKNALGRELIKTLHGRGYSLESVTR